MAPQLLTGPPATCHTLQNNYSQLADSSYATLAGYSIMHVVATSEVRQRLMAVPMWCKNEKGHIRGPGLTSLRGSTPLAPSGPQRYLGEVTVAGLWPNSHTASSCVAHHSWGMISAAAPHLNWCSTSALVRTTRSKVLEDTALPPKRVSSTELTCTTHDAQPRSLVVSSKGPEGGGDGAHARAREGKRHDRMGA
jgi:hypothetical protein